MAHAASSVVINEIQTGGADADDEFIELWNGSDTTIALDDWSLQYKTATGATINKRNFEKDATIPAQGYYLIATKVYTGSTSADLVQSSISLAKSGGNLYLVRNQEVVTSKDDPDIVDRVAWGTGDSAEDKATPTPEAGQSLERNDGADTDNNATDFTIRAAPTPMSSKISPSASRATEVISSPPSASGTTTVESQKTETAPKTKEKKPQLSINELLPNPLGNDEDEFIEFINTGDTALALKDWKITTRLNQIYVFSEGILVPHALLVLPREKSKLALQNDKEELRIFASNADRATETVKYTNAPEGESLMRNSDNDFVWSTTPSPGTMNHLLKKRSAPYIELTAPKEGAVGELLNFDASDSFDPEGEALTFQWDFGDGYGKAENDRVVYQYLKPGKFTVTLTVTDKEGLSAITTHAIQIKGEDLLTTPVIASPPTVVGRRSNLKTDSRKTPTSYPIASSTDDHLPPRNDKKTLASGTIRGVVTVPPGVLAKTYGYMLCESPCVGEGVRIRMTKAEWPELKRGDVITVTGKTSTTGNEPSFLTRKEWVRVLGQRKRIEPQVIAARDLDDTMLHQFITITGEVTEKKSGLLYLDDGAGEISVQTKSSTQFIGEGDRVKIMGVVAKNTKGFLVKASEPIEVVNAETKKSATPMKIVRDPKSERKNISSQRSQRFLQLARTRYFFLYNEGGKKIQYRLKKSLKTP